MTKIDSSCTDIHSDNFFEVVIVGGGTCGLAVASRLCENAPGSIYTEDEHQRFHWLKSRGNKVGTIHKGMTKTSKYVAPTKLTAENILVLDALADSFLGGWDNQFRSCQIPHLRSPMFFHPDPVNIDGMITFAHQNKRERDLMEIQNVVGKEYSKHQLKRTMKKKAKQAKQPAPLDPTNSKHQDRSGIVDINMRDWRDYYRPSTPFFRDFCTDIIDRYGLKDCVRKDEVVALKYTDLHIYDQNYIERGFVVTTESGKVYGCKTCVVASGHRGKINYPIAGLGKEKPSLDAACHTTDIFYEKVPFPHPRLMEKLQRVKKSSEGSNKQMSKSEENMEKSMEEKKEMSAATSDYSVKDDSSAATMTSSEQMKSSPEEVDASDLAEDIERYQMKTNRKASFSKSIAMGKMDSEIKEVTEAEESLETGFGQHRTAKGRALSSTESIDSQESLSDDTLSLNSVCSEESAECRCGEDAMETKKTDNENAREDMNDDEKFSDDSGALGLTKKAVFQGTTPSTMAESKTMAKKEFQQSMIPETGKSKNPEVETPSNPVKTFMSSDPDKKPHLVIVGGGLTSAQLAHVACTKGIYVTLILRGPVKIKHFDFHLDWVTKYKNVKKSAFYMLDTDEERAQLILDARGGGSINPEYHMKVNKHQAAKRLKLMKFTTLKNSKWDEESKMWDLELVTRTEDGKSEDTVVNLNADYVICATGISPDLRGLGFLNSIIDEYPIDIVGGFPCLTDNLQWCEELPLYMVGKNASLRIGPTSANLDGARTGAERVGWKIQEDLAKNQRSTNDTRLQLAGGNMNWYTLLGEA